MLKIKGQRGFFVFSDPAGAKACLALVKSLHNKEILIISDRKYSFYSEFNLEVHLSTEKSTNEWFDFFKPDFVFTGTSMPQNSLIELSEKIELEFLRESKSRTIKTYSFIDHWTNMSERFKYIEEYIYPDELWLIDNFAKKKAIEVGIDENIIEVSGNPYYNYLKEWKSNMSKDDLFNKIGLRKNEKFILFAPEPISSFNLEEKYGFNELSGLIHLNKSLIELKLGDIKIIIKAHPNQDHKIFTSYITKQKNNIYLKDSNINNLIYYSECVVGYFSNSLIEANVMKKKILRVLIDLKDKDFDVLKNKNIGKKIYSFLELSDELQKLFLSMKK